MKKLVLLSRLFDEGRALLEGKVQLEEHFCDDPMQRLDAIKDADGIILGNQNGKLVFFYTYRLNFLFFYVFIYGYCGFIWQREPEC